MAEPTSQSNRLTWELETLYLPEYESQNRGINICLIAIQAMGLILLFVSLAGTTQIASMNTTTITALALSGTGLLIVGSAAWAKAGFQNKYPAMKILLYVITAVALASIVFGAIAINGTFPNIGIEAARYIIGSGFILTMPLFLPAVFACLSCCFKPKELPSH